MKIRVSKDFQPLFAKTATISSGRVPALTEDGRGEPVPGPSKVAPSIPVRKSHRGIKTVAIAAALALPVLLPVMQSFDIVPSPLFAGSSMAHVQLVNNDGGGQYQVSKSYSLPGDGSWDYTTYNAPTHELFVGHGSRIEVLNTQTDQLQVLQRTGDMIGVHGIAIAPGQNKAFVTDGITSKVTVFDLNTMKPTGDISVGKTPDNIVYDSSSKMIYAMDDDANAVSVINPATDQVVHTIALSGSPEEGIADGNGHLFVNLNDTNQVAEIDTSTMQVTGNYSVAPGTGPTTLAVDPANHILYVGCDNNTEVMLNTQTHQVVGHVAIGDDEDAAGFNPATGQAFSSNGSGTMDVIGGNQQTGFKVEQVVQTGPNAHTMALDPTTGNIYLPSGQTISSVFHLPQNVVTKHIDMPGTFHVLEVSPTH